MAKTIYLGRLPWKCGFLVKDTTTTSRRMAATFLLKRLNSGNKQISNCALLWQSVEPRLLMSLRAFKTCHSFWKRAQNIYANDIQCLYDSANKLASLKMTNHDMISFMNEAQSIVEELRMFLEVDSLDEMKKKLDKYYMVMILCAIHLDFNHIRDQLLTSHEVPSMDTFITRMIRVPTLQTPETLAVVEPSVMVATRGRGGRGTRGGGREGCGRPQQCCQDRDLDRKLVRSCEFLSSKRVDAVVRSEARRIGAIFRVWSPDRRIGGASILYRSSMDTF